MDPLVLLLTLPAALTLVLLCWSWSSTRAAKHKAEQHRRMRESYRPYGGSPRGAGGVGLLRHCETLIANSEQAAVEYTALAKLHRQMATEAKE